MIAQIIMGIALFVVLLVALSYMSKSSSTAAPSTGVVYVDETQWDPWGWWPVGPWAPRWRPHPFVPPTPPHRPDHPLGPGGERHLIGPGGQQQPHGPLGPGGERRLLGSARRG
jgi:hypothetical protein